MKAIVTGGAGFIGSHICDLLIKEGHEVMAVDDMSRGQHKNIAHLIDNPKFKLFEASICDFQKIRPVFNGIDWVFHLAGLADIVPAIENPREYYEVNVDGTFNVMECSKEANCKRVVYAASSSCYGLAETIPTPESATCKPEHPYALTKYLGEQLVLHYEKVYQIPSISLRLFNVFGPRSRTKGAYGAVFGVFLAQKLHNKPFTVVGDGNQTRDFTFVTDVAKAFYLAAQSEITGKVFNVGSGGHYSINRLVGLLGGEIDYIPKRPGEPDCTFADITEIKNHLKFKPKVSFEEGVRILLENIDSFRDAPLWDKEKIEKATEMWFKCLEKNERKICFYQESMN